MNQADRKKRAKALHGFLGHLVSVHLKNTSIIESSQEDSYTVTNSLYGVVIDADEFYLYLGESPDEYDTAIGIEDIGTIRITENIPESLRVNIPGDESVH